MTASTAFTVYIHQVPSSSLTIRWRVEPSNLEIAIEMSIDVTGATATRETAKAVSIVAVPPTHQSSSPLKIRIISDSSNTNNDRLNASLCPRLSRTKTRTIKLNGSRASNAGIGARKTIANASGISFSEKEIPSLRK